CGTSVPQPLESEEEGESCFFSGFTWESVVIGYSFGLVVGTVMWSLMFKAVDDSRKIFTPEQYPSWVAFSNQQKAASELVRSSVEPILEQYRPVILASLKFSKFTLGTVAPQFTG
ncbi:hypothetical protein HAX54_006435, partial [Datura stramonium]|nr:hypothetical protein [Datura stramonium]